MSYRPDPGITQPTEIFVSPLTSPHGYDVQVSGGSATQSGSLVRVAGSSSETVMVRITPRS